MKLHLLLFTRELKEYEGDTGSKEVPYYLQQQQCNAYKLPLQRAYLMIIAKFLLENKKKAKKNNKQQQQRLLYNLEKRRNFIGLERSRGQSIYCHIHWLARACQCILVTKIRLLAVFSVLVLLF